MPPISKTLRPAALALALALLPAAAQAEERPNSPGPGSPGPGSPGPGPLGAQDRAADGRNRVATGGYTVDELRRGAVYDEDGELIARVRDLVIDGDREISGVVLAVPGPLGIDFDMDVEIAPLRLARGDDGRLYTGLTKEKIESVPAVARRNGRWRILQ